MGKEAWQNPSATLSLSEEAHLAPILTLQKSDGGGGGVLVVVVFHSHHLSALILCAECYVLEHVSKWCCETVNLQYQLLKNKHVASGLGKRFNILTSGHLGLRFCFVFLFFYEKWVVFIND